MMPDFVSFLGDAKRIVGSGRCRDEPGYLEALSRNTLAVKRTLLAVVRPRATDQVAALVRLAGRIGIPLYPVSRGRNVGYGDSAPVLDGHVLLDLSDMRSIREYDPDLGHVVIEAGVSQQDLYGFLQERDAPFWMDATGAGLDASIVGNTLEGGFGHTPLGNHREEFTDAEVVLGTGQVLRTGRFPGFGPDLKGLFVQSNFGVVTAMRIRLLPRPEHFESFVLRADRTTALGDMVDTLRVLRRDGVITSCVHIANPVRYLVSSRLCPPEFADRVVTDQDAMRVMSSRLLPVGHWNAAGGLYGLKQAVAAHRRKLQRAFKGLASICFFSDSKLNRMQGLAHGLEGIGLSAARRIRESLESFRHIHGLMQGIPSDEAYRNILWRVCAYEELGLIWFAPTLDAKGREAEKLLELATPAFAEHGFEMPLTITLVTPDRLVGVFNIVFNKTAPDQVSRAHALYARLRRDFGSKGIGTYRSSILGMEELRPTDDGVDCILRKMKSVLDPIGVISRGRYGIQS